MRNGVIDRWDARVPNVKTDTLVDMSDAPPSSSGHCGVPIPIASIDHLRVVHDHALLVRTVRGDVRDTPPTACTRSES